MSRQKQTPRDGFVGRSLAWGQPALRLLAHLGTSLRTRILLPTALLFALTMGAMVAGTLVLDDREEERIQGERAEMFSRLITAGLANAMLEGSADGISAMLETVTAHRADILAVNVLGGDGRVRFSSRRESLNGKPWASLGHETLLADEAGDGVGGKALVRPLFNTEACARCHGPVSKPNGWLDIRFTARRGHGRGHLWRWLLATSVPAFLLLIGINWMLLTRQALGPLRRLIAAMRRAEAGDLGVRADEGRTDELGVAARGFDAAHVALQRSQEQLEALYRERLVRADRFAAIGELATGLAHEIKNPLAGISGALELLAEDLAADPRQSGVVAEMRHQVGRLANTMQSLLGYARAPKPQLRPTDLNDTVRKVLFLVDRKRAKAPVEVAAELAEHLPRVMADPAQLEQVFLNICLNATQAMGAQGGRLTVSSALEGDRVVVRIADTGPGIPEEVRPHIFEPFYTTRREGTGLGLPIAARIVEEHGGRIDYSCPGLGGTVFEVSLFRILRAGADEAQAGAEAAA